MIVEKFSSVKELNSVPVLMIWVFLCNTVLKDFKTQISDDSSNRLIKSESMIEIKYHLFDQGRLFELSTTWRFQFVSSI